MSRRRARGIETGHHAAPLNAGRTGVLHGAKTRIMADDDGQIVEAHSISAGLDYPGVGPEHAQLHATGRATYLAADDDEALAAAYLLARTEGIIPALESSHALAKIKAAAEAETARRHRPAKSPGVLVGTRRQGSGDAALAHAWRWIAGGTAS